MTATEPGAGPGQPPSDVDWRAAAIVDLQGMLLTDVGVGELLQAITETAALRAGEDTSATIIVRRGGHAAVAAASDIDAGDCDRAEQESGDGPCLLAGVEQHVVLVPDIAAETRWPQWRGVALERGFKSAASLPGTAAGDVDIALNLYSRAGDPWEPSWLDQAGRYAEEAARAVALALRRSEDQQTKTDLKDALVSRAVIDQAIGVIMAQNRCAPDAAFAILRAASQHRNEKLRDVAAGVVERVSGSLQAPRGFRER